MKQPLISLGMSVFNRSRYVAEAIESVLKQNYSNWELHIVDDGSSDSSDEIVQIFADQDDRIHLHRREHRGAGAALHDALSQCAGEFLGWLDSDDQLVPDALSTMLSALQTLSFKAAYSNHRTMDVNGRDTGIGYRCSIPYSREALLSHFMTFHFRLMRREVYEQTGGIDPVLPAAIDYDFCLRLSEITDIFHVPIALYRYRQHPDSLSNRKRDLQFKCSKNAVERALQRRGLDRQFQLKADTHFRLEAIA